MGRFESTDLNGAHGHQKPARVYDGGKCERCFIETVIDLGAELAGRRTAATPQPHQAMPTLQHPAPSWPHVVVDDSSKAVVSLSHDL